MLETPIRRDWFSTLPVVFVVVFIVSENRASVHLNQKV